MEHINRFKAAIAAISALLTALWGWCGWLVFVWILAMAMDYVSGTLKAKRSGTWSSSVARDGLWHKASEVISVLAALLLDVAISVVLPNIPGLTVEITYSFLLCPLVTVWYIVTEAGSIVENAGEMGAPIPAWLGFAVSTLKKQVDNAVDPEGKPHDKEYKEDT